MGAFDVAIIGRHRTPLLTWGSAPSPRNAVVVIDYKRTMSVPSSAFSTVHRERFRAAVLKFSRLPVAISMEWEWEAERGAGRCHMAPEPEFPSKLSVAEATEGVKFSKLK